MNETLIKKLSSTSRSKLEHLNNSKLNAFIAEYIELCEPDSVYVCDDSDADAEYVRQKALEKGEEKLLAKKGQTIHYDGPHDQGRDKDNTLLLVKKEELVAMGNLNCREQTEGLAEVKKIAQGIMRGKEMVVKLFCECPPMSPFSIGCAQITDSYYVAHAEDILYRRGYEHFLKMADKNDFFQFVHSAGQLDERGCSKNLNQRRIYMDLENYSVFTLNNQYAGNSVGLKKLSMRLAINKSGREGWLCEHMFIMGCQNKEKKRTTYFCGAYPSACGKTATAMLPGETIIGDDIAYLKKLNGEFRAANVERGIFGIIQDVNEMDDPVIYKVLNEEREMIFSNVLAGPDNNPYWKGMGIPTPQTGTNHSGPNWSEDRVDSKGKKIPLSHGNARYTIRLDYLSNLDPHWNDRQGIQVGGIIYGGRDSDTSVPVEESLNWQDGIIMKACTLESETTSATLGAEGVRAPQPMANMDFISYPVGRYVQNNLDFINGVNHHVPIFATNYFLKTPDGKYCSHKLAKKVWLHWAEQRVHQEVGALETPTGLIPHYEDLKRLFKNIFNEDYTREEYEYQFSFRCQAWLAKLDRSIVFFKKNVPDCPTRAYEIWSMAKDRINKARAQFGDTILPGKFQPG
jgi:phosphoenolpyruvate carboxykinase (GTP)